jgi:hypothetical protein
MSVVTTDHRLLYDKDFIEAGCPPELYDETTTVDNTAATYVTNFIITAVCILACVRLSNVAGSKSSPACDPLLSIGFFLFIGGASFSAGINHIIVERTTDQPVNDITLYMTSISNCIANISLTLYVLKMLDITRFSSSLKKRIIWWSAFVVMVGLLVYIIVTKGDFLVVMAVSLGTVLFVIIAWIAQGSFFNYMKAFGEFVLVASFLTQFTLGGKCGDNGYAVCFKGCPLDPIRFNQNALFHVILLIGLVILAWAEDRSPSVEASVYRAANDDERNGDDAVDPCDEKA